MKKHLIPVLKQRLTKHLPGWEAQKLMSPLPTEKYRLKSTTAKNAAVMLLLYPDEKEILHLIYIKRPASPFDKHSGQVSFPGGKVELTDGSFVNASLRETEEEIGINAMDIDILGQLSPLYIYASNFYVEPIVAYLNYKPQLILQKSEVDYDIRIKLQYLLQDSSKGLIDYEIRNMVFKNMPYYKLNDEILWGATAMITSEFLYIVKQLV